MRPFIPPFDRKQKEPELYWVTCMKCGWKEIFELVPCEMIRVPAPGETEPQGPRLVAKLPARCPKCGARVEKYKLPPRIKY